MKKVCAMCGELKKEGMITKEGMTFCDLECHKSYMKDHKKKNVCEFC